MEPVDRPFYSWQAWSGLLVAMYLATVWLGWHHLLIPDEIRPLLMAAKSWQEELEYIRLDLVQTPLSFALERLWMDMFHHSDNAIKAWIVFVNVPAIVLLTYLARMATRHWRLASFFFAAPYLRIGSAVNLARMYGLLLLLGAAAFILWDRWRREPTTGRLVAWALVSIALIYTHGSALLLLGGFTILTLLLGPQRWKFTLAACLAGLSLLPWIATVYPVYKARGIEENVIALRRNPNVAVAQLPFFFFSGEDPGGAAVPVPLRNWRWFREGVILALVLNGAIAMFALRASGRRLLAFPRDRDSLWLWIGGGIFAAAIIPLYLCSVAVMPVIHTRYVLLVLPAYWLTLILLAHLGGRPGKAILYGIVLPWVFFGIISIDLTYRTVPLRQGVDLISSQIGPSDLILCDRAMPTGWQVYWEWTRRLHRSGQVEILPSSNVTPYNAAIVPAKEMGDLPLDTTGRVWFFYSWEKPPDAIVHFLNAKGFAVRATPSHRLQLFQRPSQ